VMSRGSQATCQHMIYERLDKHGPWLVELALASSTRLGIAPPVWAAPKTVEDAGADAAPVTPSQPTEEKSGCAYGSAPSNGFVWLVIGGALVAMRRRLGLPIRRS